MAPIILTIKQALIAIDERERKSEITFSSSSTLPNRRQTETRGDSVHCSILPWNSFRADDDYAYGASDSDIKRFDEEQLGVLPSSLEKGERK